MRELSVGDILSNAFSIGLKNAISLLGAIVLWGLTIWIPYLNVGTTIGLVCITAKMGRGEVVSPTEIFDGKYRKQMGEFFLVSAFIGFGSFIGTVFGFIPGMVISLAWSLAPLLVIDKGRNPTAALQESNDLTYGKKWTIFFGYFLIGLVGGFALAVIGGIGFWIHPILGVLLFLPIYFLMIAVCMGANAYIYATLTGGTAEAPAGMQPAYATR